MEIVNEIIKIVLTSVLSVLVGILSAKVKALKKVQEDKEQDNKLFRAGMKQVLFYTLESKHEAYTFRGYCSSAEKREFDNTYTIYHQLGGNGTGTRYNNEVQELPEHHIEN